MRPSAKSILCVTTACGLALLSDIGAWAQEADKSAAAQSQIGEIIVTARKRQESLLKVPVVMTAIGADQLDRLQVTDMDDLPKLVPGLTLGEGLLSNGTYVAIRGVGTSQQDPSIDQSISLNIDGLSLTQGLAFSSGMFDLAQIEVLKGPQALFYGKSSPGGVIALRTADPTDEVEIIARAGYEFEAEERRGELIISGPISDTLKGRLAGMYSTAQGYFENEAVAVPGTGAMDPTYRHDPRSRNHILRGTMLWNPMSRFSARLKVNFVRDYAVNSEAGQLASCPEGPGQTVAPFHIPFISGDNCKLDRKLRVVYMDPANFVGIINGGVPFLKTRQRYGTLELNYELSPELTLTSTTAYYRLRSTSLVNTHHSAAAGPTLAYSNRFGRRDFTEEVRLNSDFASAVNFTLGAFYQDSWLLDGVQNQGNTAYGLGAFAGDGQTIIDIETYSVFGQVRWQIMPQLELAAGARWTDEERTQEPFDFLTGQPIPVALNRIHASNVSPEFTLTYTPADDITLFAAYKRAYKSGSFSAGTVPLPGANNAFDDEKVKGGEIGLKSRLLDRQLLVNVAVYDYRYDGLQVGAIEPTVGVPIIRTVNAGSARTYGIDLDVAYRPAMIYGLSLNASLNWNRGRYKDLTNIPCWSGQTIALGCNLVPNPITGNFTAQNLSGTPMIRAPEWQSTFGFDYEFPVGSNLKLLVSNSNQYSSKYVTFLAVGRPGADHYQDSFIKSDVSFALRDSANRWELALIGKNITDEITTGLCSPANAAGGLIFGDETGAATSGPSGLGEVDCFTQRGRSAWFRFTLNL